MNRYLVRYFVLEPSSGSPDVSSGEGDEQVCSSVYRMAPGPSRSGFHQSDSSYGKDPNQLRRDNEPDDFDNT